MTRSYDVEHELQPLRTYSVTRSAGGKTTAALTEEGVDYRCQVNVSGDTSRLGENLASAHKQLDWQVRMVAEAKEILARPPAVVVEAVEKCDVCGKAPCERSCPAYGGKK